MTHAALPTFPSVEAFYADDERRRLSPEWDYGVWWCDEAGGVYRLTWVCDTGELIVVHLSGPIYGRLLGADALVVSAGRELAVAVVAVVEGEENVEALLDGWAQVCGEPESLAWVLERVREPEAAA